MEVEIRSTKAKVDKTWYTKKVIAALNKLWRDATRAFVKAIVENDLIKVETGMSMAQLLPLSRALRMVSSIHITPKIAAKKAYGGWHTGQTKSVAFGEHLGQDAYILIYGTMSKPEVMFGFDIEVYQYWLHETSQNYALSHNWQTIPAAEAAFLGYINENWWDYLPSLDELFNFEAK